MNSNTDINNVSALRKENDQRTGESHENNRSNRISFKHRRLKQYRYGYLDEIGELTASVGEAYEETAERLDDDVMRAAARKWWRLESA